MKLAVLCYLKQNGKTLMIHRVKKKNDLHKNKWNGIGGKFEKGESPEDALKREVFEESGYQLIQFDLKGILTFPFFDHQQEDWYVFVYTSNQFEGTMIKNCQEGNLKWIENENLQALNLWPSDRFFLKWIEENRFFSAKFSYKEENCIDQVVTFFDKK